MENIMLQNEYVDAKVALVAATKEIGLEVNAHKTKYMTVSRD